MSLNRFNAGVPVRNGESSVRIDLNRMRIAYADALWEAMKYVATEECGLGLVEIRFPVKGDDYRTPTVTIAGVKRNLYEAPEWWKVIPNHSG